jgi:hypothetical protein
MTTLPIRQEIIEFVNELLRYVEQRPFRNVAQMGLL